MSEFQSNIDLYKSLFRGREDVYAVRWEKEGRSGYMPAYKVDWEDYKKYKASGGTFANYPRKEYLSFTDNVLWEHFEGKSTVGIYPLLPDNTSFFIAADFDEENWQDAIKRLYDTCHKYELPVVIERSRSGNGGHLWLFFEENIPAFQSRKLMFDLLLQAEILSKFEKEPSFDRLFPNQDTHSGKAMGNLIALPLQGNSFKKGNSCFVDLATGAPYADQWGFLKSVRKVTRQKIENLFLQLSGPVKECLTSTFSAEHSFELEIYIKGQVFLKRIQLNPKLTEFLRENLNFLNSDYFVKKRLGKTAYNIEKYFKLIEETPEGIIIPRGFVSTLFAFCKAEHIPVKIVDERQKLEPITIHSKIELRPQQEEVLEKTEVKDFGVIVSPPGSGKTIIALELIARKEQPTLILVHRKQLFDQWIERIQSFLGIPKDKIGQIGNQKDKIGKEITVAMIQSLTREKSLELIQDRFGMIIVDECHHIPAKSFREVVTQFNSFYLYGLTATPKRKNNDEKLIYVYIGNILYEMSQKEVLSEQVNKIEINIRETDLFVPFDYKVDQYETVSRVLIYDTQRNAMIISDIEQNISRFKSILILTERKAHVDLLNLYLKDKYETIAISGDDSERSRKSKLEQIEQGHFQIIISTGQYFGEGIDISSLECLFIVYPFAFEGKLVQYIGRIQRSGKPPVIFDYRDSKIDYFDKMFKQRKRYYNKLIK